MNVKMYLPLDFIVTYFLIQSSEFSFLKIISIIKHLWVKHLCCRLHEHLEDCFLVVSLSVANVGFVSV